MVRRPVALVVALVLYVEAFGVAVLNWTLGTLVDRQHMSLAGLEPGRMAAASKGSGIVFGLYFVLCGVVALLVAVRDRRPAGFGRILLISAAVVHGLLGAFAWGLVGWPAFLFMMAVLALIVLLLMTYDPEPGPEAGAPAQEPGGPQDAGPADDHPRGAGPADDRPRGAGPADDRPQGAGPVSPSAPTTP
nr:DUF308 domain-containing protein [Streptomyces echinoruber]